MNIEFGNKYIKEHFGGNLALGTQQTIQNKFRTNPKTMVDHVIQCLDLKGDESIFDIGCGNGFILRDIVTRLKNGSTVVAIDISKAMLDLAKKNVNFSWVPIEFVEGDAMKLTVEKYGKFDRVMVNFLFHYISEPSKFILILKSLLKLNGRLNVAIEAQSSMSKMYSLHFRGMKDAGFPKDFIESLPKGRRGKMVLENAGEYLSKYFNSVVEVPYEDSLKFLSVDDYMRFYTDGHGYCGVNSHTGDWFIPSMTEKLDNYVRTEVRKEINEKGSFILEKRNSIFICS